MPAVSLRLFSYAMFFINAAVRKDLLLPRRRLFRTPALVDRAYWPNATAYMLRPGRKVSAPAMSKVALVGAERGRELGI